MSFLILKYFKINMLIVVPSCMLIPLKLLFEDLGPSQHTNTGSANSVSFGRGYLFVRPMADGQSVWGNP